METVGCVIPHISLTLTLLVTSVLSAFPLCHLTENDLIQNPLFCKLLATLSQHVDRTGLTLPLRKELEKVVTLQSGLHESHWL